MKRFLSKSLPLAVFAFMVATFFMPDLAFANNAARSPTLENFAQTMSALVHILTAATLLLLQFMPPLWGTDLITGPEIIGALKPMWMFIRNIMNMVFVILLIIVIFVNLLTSGGQMGGGQWTIKEKLGKIILGLVAVNFSLLAVKVLVDAAYVGTIGLLTIADTAIDAKGTKDVEEMMALEVDTKKYTVCEKGAGGDCKPVREIINDTFCKSKDPNEDYCLFKVKDKIETDGLADPEKKNIILAFGVHFMRLESLPILAANSKSIFAVLDNALFSFVMAVAYILALVAVFVVLIVRVVMMWVMILVSPILVTGWVMGWSGGAFEEINGRFWKYLIVPVKIAAVFAFTFILIATLDAVTPSPQFYTEYIEPGNPLKPLWGDEKFKGWQFVWKIFIVVLFWKAIFLAIKDIEDVSAVTQGIQNFGSGLAKTALTYGADQIQIPGLGTAANIGQLNSGLSGMRQRITSDEGPTSLSDAVNGGADFSRKSRKFTEDMRRAGRDVRRFRTALRDFNSTNLTTHLATAANLDEFKTQLKGLTDGELSSMGISNRASIDGMTGQQIVTALESGGAFRAETADPERTDGDTTAVFSDAQLNQITAALSGGDGITKEQAQELLRLRETEGTADFNARIGAADSLSGKTADEVVAALRAIAERDE